MRKKNRTIKTKELNLNNNAIRVSDKISIEILFSKTLSIQEKIYLENYLDCVKQDGVIETTREFIKIENQKRNRG